MAKAKWYTKGSAGVKRSKQVDEEARARSADRGPRRFYLPADTVAKVTFLDTPSFFLMEHNLKINGKFQNFFTCIQDVETCPLCEDGNNASYIVAGTVVDHSKWTDKEGHEHQHEKKLFVAKGNARAKVLRQIDKHDGNIAWWMYELARGNGQRECNTGEDMESIKNIGKVAFVAWAKKNIKLPKDTTLEEFLAPFDYEKIFAPKDVKVLRKLVGAEDPVGSVDDGDLPGGDDDIPFDGPDSDSDGGGSGEESSSIDDLL